LTAEKSRLQPENWKPRSEWSGASGATAPPPAFTRRVWPIVFPVTVSTNFTLYCLVFLLLGVCAGASEALSAGAWASLATDALDASANARE